MQSSRLDFRLVENCSHPRRLKNTRGTVVPSPLKHPDQLIWRGSKNGMFTVKSTYHLEKQIRAQAWGENSTACWGGAHNVEEHMEYANAGCGEELPVEGGERLTP
jgi:hypothetical protein